MTSNIINASWGSYNFTSTALYDAIDSTRQAGMIFVAAAGNDNNNNDVNPLYPASYNLDNIIAVAATDRTDNRAFFSNYGATTVHLGAPGYPVFSCWNGSDSDYQDDQGTSMAAPHVVGACALVWAHTPGLSYKQVIARVLSSVDPLPAFSGKCVSGGRLDLQNALSSTAMAANPISKRKTSLALANDDFRIDAIRRFVSLRPTATPSLLLESGRQDAAIPVVDLSDRPKSTFRFDSD